MKHLKKPACPNCGLLTKNPIINHLLPEDLITTKCRKCTKKYYIYYVKEDDYYTFFDYYNFHKVKLSD